MYTLKLYCTTWIRIGIGPRALVQEKQDNSTHRRGTGSHQPEAGSVFCACNHHVLTDCNDALGATRWLLRNAPPLLAPLGDDRSPREALGLVLSPDCHLLVLIRH